MRSCQVATCTQSMEGRASPIRGPRWARGGRQGCWRACPVDVGHSLVTQCYCEPCAVGGREAPCFNWREGAPMRGQGRVFRPKVRGEHTKVWWLDYSVRGERHRESSETTSKKAAQ